jgi:hypothetical protein
MLRFVFYQDLAIEHGAYFEVSSHHSKDPLSASDLTSQQGPKAQELAQRESKLSSTFVRDVAEMGQHLG